MKRFLFAWLALAVAAAEAKEVRVMSYNVRNGIGMDQVMDYERTAGVILRAAPDVCGVQEADSATGRSGGRDLLGELAKRTGLHPTYAKAIDFLGGAYGIGLLSKEKPLRVQRLPLPGREEARVALVAEFEDYVVLNTHLTLTKEDKARSVGIVDSIAGSYKNSKPVILTGDLNLKPDSESYHRLSRGFVSLTDTKQFTFPAGKPTECIDYIMGYTGGSFYTRSLHSEVVDAPVESDHRPILATVEYGPVFWTRPYLQNPVGNGITVAWLTNVPAYGRVEYGTDTTNLTVARTLVDGQAVAGNTLNKIRIDNLIPGQKYYYRVISRELLFYGAYRKDFGGTAVSPFYSFALPEDQAKDFTAVIFNDLHQNRETIQALANRLKRKGIDFDFVLFNGDAIDDPADQKQAVETLSYYIDQIGGPQTPLFFLRGNHEIRNAYSIGLRELFDYVGGKTYGAFNWGDTRFVMLDCGEDKPDSTPVYYGMNDFSRLRADQAEFLKAELRSKVFKKAGKRVLVHHIPTYGLNGDPENGWYNPSLSLWEPHLRNAPFNVALNGHTHRYAYYPARSRMEMNLVNNYPIVIGGGPRPERATVMVLDRKGDRMALSVLNYKGEEILNLDL